MPRSITIDQQSRADFELPYDIDDDVFRVEIHNFAGASLDWLPETVERLKIIGPGPLCDQDTRNLKNLDSLELLGCDLEPGGVFPPLPNLKKLKMIKTNVSTIRSLEEADSLDFLRVIGGELRDISSLGSHPNLKKVSLSELENLVDVSSLGSCTLIEDLDISETSVRNIEFVKNLPSLKRFSAESTSIDTIAFLGGCKGLESINVSDTGVNDLTSLKTMKNLKFLKFDGREFSEPEAISEFLKDRHPNPLVSSYRSAKGKLDKAPTFVKATVEWIECHRTTAGIIFAIVCGIAAWASGKIEKLLAVLS